MRLGVLDFGLVPPGRSASDVVADTVHLARACEELGFAWYWLAEHHDPRCAWTRPEVVLSLLGHATHDIRIGAAGVLLSLYSPLVVASEYRLLEALYPGRVDLGLCRGTPESPRREALQHRRTGPFAAEDYAAMVADVLAHLERTDERRALPDGAAPRVWVLGSGEASAAVAARLGAAYCHSLLHRPDASGDGLLRYERTFRPQSSRPAPVAAVALALSCAHSEAAATEQCRDAASVVAVHPAVAGTPEACSAAIRRIADEHGTANVTLLDLAIDPRARLRSLQSIARAFDLRATPARAEPCAP